MYTPSKMTRNLVRGNVGEAFFRYWYETNCYGLDDLTLRQFGYNPDGIIVGEEKKEMLKRLERSTDFAIYRVADLEENPDEAAPILGISINTQHSPFTMYQARTPKMNYNGKIWGCYNCPRGKRCFNGDVNNIWFNEYNISNDYRLFIDEFKVDVILVTIISKMPNLIWNARIKRGIYEKELREYLFGGYKSIIKNKDIIKFLDYLLFDQRYKDRTHTRNYQLVWLKYSDILEGKINYHITGAPVSRGLPRPVVCIDLKNASSERTLIKFIEGFSKRKVKTRSPIWYADIDEAAFIDG